MNRNKQIHFSVMWNRYLIGFHYIKPNGDLFWTIFLGPIKISYDYNVNHYNK